MLALPRTLVGLLIVLSACAAPVDGSVEPDPIVVDGKADGAGRGTEVIERIEMANAELGADELEEKLSRMAESPFVFFRGTNHLYWADMAQHPLLSSYGGTADTRTFLCGDLHALNYGTFHDDDDRIVYDLNDFDEAIIADYQLDVWRMAVSLVLLGWDNGLDDDDIETSVRAFAEAYLDRMAEVHGNDDEESARVTVDNAYGRLDELLDDVERTESRVEMLDKWTVLDGAARVFDTALEDLEPAPERAAEIASAMAAYGETLAGGLAFDTSYFHVKSVARRLGAGTGSLGTPRYYVLIEGPSDGQDDDILLDVKQQGAPTGLAFVGDELRALNAAAFLHPAQRVALAQRGLLTDVDDHLGWMELSDGVYSVRERSPWKESFPVEELDTATRLENLSEQWGTILATDHARADRDFDAGPLEHSVDGAVDDRTDGDHAGFRDLVHRVATGYADQVLVDYAAFVESRP